MFSIFSHKENPNQGWQSGSSSKSPEFKSHIAKKKKMQLKMTLRFHHTIIRMAVIKKTNLAGCW
jgi:hypothetical protein